MSLIYTKRHPKQEEVLEATSDKLKIHTWQMSMASHFELRKIKNRTK